MSTRAVISKIIAAICLFLAGSIPAHAGGTAGIFRVGAGAYGTAIGGADAAVASTPISAMHSNPAGLAFIRERTAEVSGTTVDAFGRFTNASNTDGQLRNMFAAVPDAATALPFGERLTIGISVIPDVTASVNWRYVDAPGGTNGVTSYGLQKHYSEISRIRSAIGFGYAINSRFSVGASIGHLYNENKLEAPYVFQSHPALRGIKTELRLNARGDDWNGHFGFLYRPDDRWQFAGSYMMGAEVKARGDANGDLSEQFRTLGAPFTGAQSIFHYNAEVTVKFPQVATGAVRFKAAPKLTTMLQADWYDWSEAYDELRVFLTGGTNPNVNALVGSTQILDIAPLEWKDRMAFRAGAEYEWNSKIKLRGGYSYGKSPVPDRTLTALTAAISEHTLSTGMGYSAGSYDIDLAYQFNLPETRRIGASGLRAGEYSNSSIKLSAHWLASGVKIRF